MTERVRIKTDKDGYASIDLIRFGMYQVTMEAMEDFPRFITVPDQASVNLPDLLFPVVGQVVLDPAGPYALTVGEDLVITPVVTTIAGVVLEGTATTDVQWKSSDTTVVTVLPSQDTITLRGVAVGIAELQAERLDETIIRIPNTPIVGVPQPITVS